MTKPYRSKQHPKTHAPSERKLKAVAKRAAKAASYIARGPRYKYPGRDL